MSTKEQFKMYLEPDLINQLTDLAVRFGRSSKQAVAEEIVSVYLPTWIAVNDSMRRAVDFQTQIIGKKSEQSVNEARAKKDEGAEPATLSRNKKKLDNEDNGNRNKSAVSQPGKRHSK